MAFGEEDLIVNFTKERYLWIFCVDRSDEITIERIKSEFFLRPMNNEKKVLELIKNRIDVYEP